MATYKVTITYKSGKTTSKKNFTCGHEANRFAGSKINADNVRAITAVKFPDEGEPITMLAFDKNIPAVAWQFPHQP
jgi:hypothetical protein